MLMTEISARRGCFLRSTQGRLVCGGVEARFVGSVDLRFGYREGNQSAEACSLGSHLLFLFSIKSASHSIGWVLAVGAMLFSV
ncbi:uncharacterized protein BO95DRAFT_206063 [Aspergillus brunneoviolaceus CBS 621.78]|uniref:Uncharacterized protein n=1 Tax=Aspergillus brunneoviolaceus CBS 621.78 TaxID=1450534 RepID=A0ACD1G307_9EURO|nr:hypothetical protein BO95DRAFT_206063 [Aspergillus brunneoviolaceus CBS 621.78]RAH43629.1 hypothetical protein BO95DRAFT_206063 [Aspergillus brunneoviolaceus CBS 621.78]